MTPRPWLTAAFAAAVLAVAGPAAAEVDQPWLGIRYQDGHVGALVTGVFEESGALASGLRVGDEIFEIDGLPVDMRTGALKPHIESRAIGEKVSLHVYRDGRVLTLRAVLSRRLTESELLHTQLVGKRARAFSLVPPSKDPDADAGVATVDDSLLAGRVGVLAWFHTACRDCPGLINKVHGWVDARRDEGIVMLAGVGGRLGEDDADVAKELKLILAAAPVLAPIGVDQAAYQDYAGFENPADVLALIVVDQRGFVRMAAAVDASDDAALDDVYAAAESLLRRRPRR